MPSSCGGGSSGWSSCFGKTVTLSLYSDGWDVSGLTCRVLDADSAWLLVRADEGKKKERELLIRLDSVKGIKKPEGSARMGGRKTEGSS